MKKSHGHGLAFLISAFWFFPFMSSAQTPITASGLNTQISGPIAVGGQTQFNITGGTRPASGVNLFHSFGNFCVPNNNIANFLNNSGLATSNILGRVTGGNVSNIFGTIQTTGFGNANLFLMNPAGFLFGPNATLNVSGMVAFTSADYLRLADGARFTTSSSASTDALLSAAPVAAFGFLGSHPGAITVQGSQLSAAEGTGVSLVSGDIAVQGGTLTAPSGQINLVSVGMPASRKVSGEVVIAGLAEGLGFTPTGFRSLGTITLVQDSSLDVSAPMNTADGAGIVLIRGGQLIMDGSSFSAIVPLKDGIRSDGSGGVVEVTADQVTLRNNSAIDVTANQSRDQSEFPIGSLSPGSITMNVDIFSSTSSTMTANGLGFAGTSGVRGGAVTIRGRNGEGAFARSISLADTQITTTGCCIAVDAGPIAMKANSITLNQSLLNASAGDDVGGQITLISRGGLDIRNSSLLTTSVFRLGGMVGLEAGKRIDLTGTTIVANNLPGDAITMTAPIISITSSTLDATGSGIFGGTINLTGSKAVTLTNSTLLATGQLNAGIVRINGGARFTSQQSTISARGLLSPSIIQIDAKTVSLKDSVFTTSSDGLAGNITVNAKTLAVKNSQILSTEIEGQGGTITITSPRFYRDAKSVIDASSQFGTDGTVTINGLTQQ